MDDLELVFFKMISSLGSARSSFMEAMALARAGDFAQAQEAIEQGESQRITGHDQHFDLLQADAAGDSVWTSSPPRLGGNTMKRVYLFCSAGMSTSLVASRMQAVADDHNLPIEVKAFSDSKLDIIVEQYHPDVILLGPQVKYKFNATRDKYEPQGIPVEVMNLDDYGNVNGERILKRAIQLLKQNKQG